ncbi:ribokinase [Serratia rubidaea]|uniref:Ribokinase n=1 Tax=Serratia rubidaea TaxID=61652 RepID=A0A3S4GIG0_SERRU|nr:ribokinase [Serratia rubidaea]
MADRLPFDQYRLIDPGPRVGLLGEEFFAMLSDSHTLLTLNRDEVAILCGDGDPVEAAQRYAAARNFTLICRLDSDGAWICDGKHPPQHIAAYPVEVVDTIGAGDATAPACWPPFPPAGRCRRPLTWPTASPPAWWPAAAPTPRRTGRSCASASRRHKQSALQGYLFTISVSNE